MNDQIYYSMLEMYFFQCGQNTSLWLYYAMKNKWRIVTAGGY